MNPFLSTIAALIRKDLRTEWRTKHAVTAGLVFSLLVLVIFNFALDLRADSIEAVAPGVLWISFTFAGVLGVGRSFETDREHGTLDGLLLAPIERGAIYLARMVTNSLLMGLVAVVTLPIFVALFNVRFAPVQMLVVVALGTVGFTAVGTLVAAIAANSRAREVMLPLLLFPLEVPVVIGSVKATAVTMGAQPAETLPWLQLLACFDVILVATSFLVFEYVIEE